MAGASGLALGSEEARFLAEMDRRGIPVFSVREHASNLADLAGPRLHRVLHRLAQKGRIRPIERGKYQVLPRAAGRSWQEHPFVIAGGVAPPPAYVTGWAALAHHDLTTQIPRVVHVALRGSRRAPLEFQGIRYAFLLQAPEKFFGYEETEITALNGAATVSVHVATPAKALLDSLDDQRLAGGFQEVVVAVARLLARPPDVPWHAVVNVARHYPNRAAVARLGYIVEKLAPGLGAQDDEQSPANLAVKEMRLLVRNRGSYPLLATGWPGAGARPNSTWHLRANVPDHVFEEALA